MREEMIGNSKVLLYQSAEEIPVHKYTKFQKYLLVHSGMGSDFEGVGLHFSKLFGFLGNDMPQEALGEAKNLYYNFYLMFEEISAPGLAFCCLVHAVNEEVMTDGSEDFLKRLLQRLSEEGLTQGLIEKTVFEVKKKLLPS